MTETGIGFKSTGLSENMPFQAILHEPDDSRPCAEWDMKTQPNFALMAPMRQHGIKLMIGECWTNQYSLSPRIA